MRGFVGDSPSGKASDSDSDTGGSNPSSPTKYRIILSMAEETTDNTSTGEQKYTGFYGIKSDLVNVSTYGKEKITFNPERGGIVFFCHDCNALVETDRPDAKKMKFICQTCKGRKISYGTEESLKEHYKRNLSRR
jgi:hypothetical protein